MSMDVLTSLGFVGVALAGLVVLFLLDSMLRGFANRFAARSDLYRHRIGTQLPRVCK
jgi:hypothetical protein